MHGCIMQCMEKNSMYGHFLPNAQHINFHRRSKKKSCTNNIPFEFDEFVHGILHLKSL